jgi:hypothetical protein
MSGAMGELKTDFSNFKLKGAAGVEKRGREHLKRYIYQVVLSVETVVDDGESGLTFKIIVGEKEIGSLGVKF